MVARKEVGRRRSGGGRPLPKMPRPPRVMPDAPVTPLPAPGDVDACPARVPGEPLLPVPAPLWADVAAPTAMLSNEHVCCSVYSDRAMLANALLALGSFKRFAPPHMRAALFTRRPAELSWLTGVDLLDCDEPMHNASIGLEAFTRRHPGITGHYYRKVAMWLYALEQGSGGAHGTDWHAFIDADVLFVRPIEPLLRYARAHRFAAMVEHWHQSVWTVFQGESTPARRQINDLFHGCATPALMKRTTYYNSGLMLARPDEQMRAAVKDVLLAATLYPELSRGIRLPEQTLLNLATMVRRIPCADLYGLCVASYHDEDHRWPAPIGRHYLGDPHGRHPHSLAARYPQIVRESLAAVGTSVEDLTDRGLWPQDPPPPPPASQFAFAVAPYAQMSQTAYAVTPYAQVAPYAQAAPYAQVAQGGMTSEAGLSYRTAAYLRQHIPSTLRC